MHQVGNSAEELLSPAGRLACAISSAVISTEVGKLRLIAMVVARVIDKSLTRRERYHQLFEQNQTDDVRMYNEVHKNGTGIADNEDGNWLTEAQRTGEFFPGRPQVRPVLDFGLSARKENSRTC